MSLLYNNKDEFIEGDRIMRKLSLLMLTFGSLCFFATPSGAASYSPSVGQAHPEFILPDIASGEPVSLSQFRGRKVLLVHFASW
jgi:hypothetical protein